ncbi:hypothetical protein ILUMI_26090 [Ignelater luminosus]|uniref:Peptidase S1 domain-containing protein n=1 Tax=Ignelater luminosus TaxID=2038154 RepID=A0A8K0FZA0_IGNLU|nr:hypothetical protein ILUMI_26090 [Ignelater luminosus]
MCNDMTLNVFFQIFLISLIKFIKCINDATFYPVPIYLNKSDTGNTTNNKMTAGQSRIVGGYICKISQHPYIVNIVSTKTLNHICGGSLIASKWVLTAGHCCSLKYKSGEHSAIAGLSFSPMYRKLIQQVVIAQMSNIIRNYRHPIRSFDIGLMQVRILL